MANNYLDQLGQWIKQKPKRGNVNQVAFLAILDDVKVALDAGYKVKAVWNNMQESKRIDIGYEVFLHYVNRLIRCPQTNQPTTRADPKLPPRSGATVTSIAPDRPASTAAKTVKSEPAKFVFNPVPPDDKELF